jgi:hypothetical protein
VIQALASDQEMDGGGAAEVVEKQLREALDDPSCISFSENIDESPNRKKHFGVMQNSSSSA